MAVAASGTITVTASGALTNSLDLSSTAQANLSKILSGAFTSGTGLAQIDRWWWDERTLAGSTTDSLDLIGGGLVDPLGVAFAPARIKILILNNLGPNIINLQRPAAATGVPIFGAAADFEPIHLNGFVCKVWPSAAGIVVTAGTGDIIEIVNTAAGTITYQIIIGGCSA
jgi:hypothetical protein